MYFSLLDRLFSWNPKITRYSSKWMNKLDSEVSFYFWLNEYEWEFIKIQFCVVDVSLLKCHARKIKRRHVSYLFRTNRTDNQVWLFHDFLTVRLHFLYCSFQKKSKCIFKNLLILWTFNYIKSSGTFVNFLWLMFFLQLYSNA